MKNKFSIERGQSLVEIIIVIGMSIVILPALLTGLISSRQGKAQQAERTQAVYLLNETVDVVRSVREKGWAQFAVNGTFHPAILGTGWTLAAGPTIVNGFTQSVIISNVNRDSAGTIVATGGTFDPSSKKVDVSISWSQPYNSTVSTSLYMTRYLSNNSFSQTTVADFTAGVLGGNTQVTNTAGGEVILANNNRAKWCTPALSATTIDLPDGPPVAVAATADATSANIPNDVFVATAPTTANSIKLAYVNVTANTDPPVATLRGKFTLDPAQYSNPAYVPSETGGLTNTFKTNDIKYYTSSSGKTYGLLATDLPTKEVVAVLVNDGDPSNDNTTAGEYQDPVNKIYKYWTFFNTTIYGIGSGLNTGFLNPTANAAETINAGDNNGFQTYPTRAYSDNNSFAVDTDSGNSTGTDCLGADKDKHRFYNYNISLPTGTTINGIEVRLDAKVDNTTGAPKMCVQLSWDAGTTWTTAKSTSTLTTGEVIYLLGGSSDTWGRSWNGDTNFTNANFRLRVVNVASNILRDFSLDWVAVKVYYSGGSLGTNDQTPFGYGAVTLTTMGDKGYIASGGYLYTFDLSNIDSKTPANGLDMVGCRIQLDGYDCSPGSPASVKKYSSGQTGTSWGDTSGAIHDDCSDGGNIELYATNDIYPVQDGSNTYIYVAVGGVTNPEFEIVNVTNIPTSSTSPTISNSSCGRISGGNSGWKRLGTYDFNSNTGTEEAANSVYANSDGTRAYISSNGGADSKQFYILNTSSKSSPAFLSGSPSTGPTSGYYYSAGANGEMYPRRSLTVLNGERVVLVGKDGVITSPGPDLNAQEYQVLNIEHESDPPPGPVYCGGINFDSGFNDLTSVSEADGDNFVYMVANTMEKQLKIIQGGPDSGIYVSDGVFESSIQDALISSSYYHFTATVSQPANTVIKAQVGLGSPVNGTCTNTVFNYVGPNGDPDAYFIVIAGVVSGTIPFGTYGDYQNPDRCFKYRFYLYSNSPDYNQTPTLYDINVNYSP